MLLTQFYGEDIVRRIGSPQQSGVVLVCGLYLLEERRLIGHS